jgi:hypothetical protein
MLERFFAPNCRQNACQMPGNLRLMPLDDTSAMHPENRAHPVNLMSLRGELTHNLPVFLPNCWYSPETSHVQLTSNNQLCDASLLGANLHARIRPWAEMENGRRYFWDIYR